MEHKKNFLLNNYLYLVALYFALFFIIRIYLGGSLERDEAEQMFLYNNLSLGYGTQPPLYTWVQQLFFYIFGSNLIALALLKNILLFSAYFFIYKSTYILTKNKTISIIAIASMFLIPPCAWECQRDLTHTVIALTTSSITLYYILYLREKNKLFVKNFIILGILTALMMLSKYNLIIFIIALIIASLFDNKLKKFILSKYIFITILVAFLTLLPHLIWLKQHLIFAIDGTLNKLNRDNFNLFTLVKNYILSILELFTLYGVIFFILFKKNITKKGSIFLKHHQIIVIILTLLILLVLQATTIKSRWLVTLLFPTIIYFATKLDTSNIEKKANTFLRISIFFMALIISAYILRVTNPTIFHKNPRFNYPYKKLITKYLNSNIKKPIYTSLLSGGNIRYIYPNLNIKILKNLNIKEKSLILIDKDTLYLKDKIEQKLNIRFKKLETNYKNSKDKFILYLGRYQ